MPADTSKQPARPSQKRLDRALHNWRPILMKVWHDRTEKNIALVAAGVTFYIILAVIPAFAALISVYGLTTDPKEVEYETRYVAGKLLPSEQNLIAHQLHQIVATDPRTLGYGVLAGIILAIYTMTRGMGGMIDALNIAYGQKEQRGLIRFYLTTIGLVGAGVASIAVVIGLIAAIVSLKAGFATRSLLLVAGWPVLTLYMTGVLAVLYRFGPDRVETNWEWSLPGAGLAAVFWSVGTIATYEYVIHFGDYNRIYGSLGAVLIYLSWLWFSIILVVLGAEINGAAKRNSNPTLQ